MTAAPHLSGFFDPVTHDLLPASRDAYLRGQLAPEPAGAIEHYLQGNLIQTNVLLGRYRELAAQEALAPPAWVAHQLALAAAPATRRPLRRPTVRLALAAFGLLVLASVVQWVRNEPLVPAPVAAAVVRAAATATQATRHFVQQLTQPAAPVAVPAAAAPMPVVAAPARLAAARPKPAPVPLLARRAPTAAPLLPDSAAAPTLPQALPTTHGAAPAGRVRGRISDEQGRPLPGATVLVQGTRLVVSANANGDYALDVPAGATLVVGYGGYPDQQLARAAGSEVLNVTLRR